MSSIYCTYIVYAILKKVIALNQFIRYILCLLDCCALWYGFFLVSHSTRREHVCDFIVRLKETAGDSITHNFSNNYVHITWCQL